MPSPAPKIELGRELGSGSTGRVRLGRLREPWGDLPAAASVAVKELDPEAPPAAAEALRREAQAAGAATSPYLVRLLHVGEGERGPYLVTGHVPGPTLREVLAEHGPLPEPQVRTLARQLCSALAALGAAGWRHGDVKPENVRLDADGNAVLLDLGFAQRVGARRLETARPGSLPYLAPEQVRGAPASPASDQFALGVVLHELATGENPFASRDAGQGDDRERWLEAIAGAPEVTPSRIVPQLSPFFDTVVRSLLDPDPERRPPADALERILEEGEAGPWWRRRVAFGAESRRGTAGWSGTHRLPLVGRAAELAELEEARREAFRSGGVVWLEGMPGAGKSRLVSEFVQGARRGEDPPLYLYGRCSPFREERPGTPVRAILRRYLQLPRNAPLGPRERDLLEGLVPPPTVDVLTRSLDPTGDRDTPGEPRALADWLVALGSAGPLVIFLDDVTFAGPMTLEILSQVGDRLSGTRALLALGLRWTTPAREPVLLENLRARLATRVPCRTVILRPLGQEHVLELVEALFHHSTPRLRLARVLLDRSGGSPGAIGEILRTLESRGEVRPGPDPGGGLELGIPPDELPLPRSVSRLIADRFGELPQPQQVWLQRLAVVGGHLERDFLLRAFPHAGPTEIDGVLATFVEEGWLVPAGSRYRFARPAQREAVFRTLSERRRVPVHSAAAQALEEMIRERPSLTLRYERAYHLRAAGRHGEFLEGLEPLLERVRVGGHPARIEALASWGLEALDALPREPARAALELDLLEAAADAADRLGHRDRQRALLDRLSDQEVDPDVDPVTAGRIYHLHGRFAGNTGQYGLARGMLRNAILLFGRGDAPELECSATIKLAHVQGHVGALTEAGRLARRALELAQNPTQRARALLALAVVAIVGDEFEAALRLVDRAMQPLRRLDDPTGGRGALAAAYLLRTRIYRLVGRPRRAFAAVQRATRLARRAGESRLEAEVAARHGRLLLDVDRVQEAELQLREALLAADEIEYRRGQALASVFLGILLAEGNDPEAPRVLARASGLAGEMRLIRIEALSLALRARVARQAGSSELADRLSGDGIALLERHGAELTDRIVIAATRALILRELGRPAEARGLMGSLERRVRRVNEHIQSPILRQRHHRASMALLAAASSPLGPIYPRSALAGLPEDPAPFEMG